MNFVINHSRLKIYESFLSLYLHTTPGTSMHGIVRVSIDRVVGSSPVHLMGTGLLLVVSTSQSPVLIEIRFQHDILSRITDALTVSTHDLSRPLNLGKNFKCPRHLLIQLECNCTFSFLCHGMNITRIDWIFATGGTALITLATCT